MLFPFKFALILVAIAFIYTLFIPDSKPREKFHFDWRRINPFRSFGLLRLRPFALGVAVVFFMMTVGELGTKLFIE